MHDRLLKKLEPGAYAFTGNVARHVLGDAASVAGRIVILWKNTKMPDEAIRQHYLSRFQHPFADVLDWDTAILFL